MFGKKKKLTEEQKKNRKQGILKTEEASAKEYQRQAADRARRKEFLEGFNN